MNLKVIAAAFVLAGSVSLLAAPAEAQTKSVDAQTTKKKTVVYNRDRTVQITRDEDGRTRTRIIIQKRSYLDPGTETSPGERTSNTDYVERPNQRAAGVIDNTPFGLYNTQSALPGPWTLPSKNNPWLQY